MSWLHFGAQLGIQLLIVGVSFGPDADASLHRLSIPHLAYTPIPAVRKKSEK
jgi:hypothetical protein